MFDVDNWTETAQIAGARGAAFPGTCAIINIGGGLGVPERREQAALDLAKLDCALGAVRAQSAAIELWLEPGRYLVAAAGVLLARVTQTKSKGDMRYVGVATGMNSLIRPALYGAWHEIVNLTRLDEPATELVNVVGPICESADVLGHDRLLPPTLEGDVLLIANAGAYGRVHELELQPARAGGRTGAVVKVRLRRQIDAGLEPRLRQLRTASRR